MRADTRRIRELKTLVQRIVQESGEPRGFDAKKWLRGFMASPKAALGGKRPLELIRTQKGRLAVRQLIERMQSGAYT